MDMRLFSHVNWSLLACTTLLFFAGLLNLYSASGTRLEDGVLVSSFYQKQIVWGICGLVCMLAAMTFDYRRLRNFAWSFYWVTFGLLVLVAVIGKNVYGATRWISFGGISFQPSELAKIAVLGLRLADGETAAVHDELAVSPLAILLGLNLIAQFVEVDAVLRLHIFADEFDFFVYQIFSSQSVHCPFWLVFHESYMINFYSTLIAF